MKRGFKVVMTVAIAAMVGVLMGCATQKVETSGFLGEYPPFEEGPGGVEKRYLKKGVDFSKYNKIMMDEVVFFANKRCNHENAQSPADGPCSVRGQHLALPKHHHFGRIFHQSRHRQARPC